MSHLESVLHSAALDVFEGLFFASVERCDGESAPAWSQTAEVRFSGAMEGVLRVELFDIDTGRLVEEMLGEAPEGQTLLDTDAVRELTNVLCGHILPRAYGSQLVFDIGTPQVSPPPTSPGVKPAARTLMSLDEGKLQLSLYLESPRSDVEAP